MYIFILGVTGFLMTMMEKSGEISGHFRDSHASWDFQSLWLKQYAPKDYSKNSVLF